MTRREHFVEFMSPGTFVDETTAKPISAWDTREALELAERIKERHGARPYGFRFLTRIVADSIPDGEGGTMPVAAKTVKESGTHYINGKLRTYDDVVRDDRMGESILRSNMRCNEWWIVCETANSYRHTGLFRPEDRVVGLTGEIIESGDDPKHIEYRKRKSAEKAVESP